MATSPTNAIPIASDVYLDLPPEPILQALGTNYNAMVRTWTIRQYQLQLEHHQKMCYYYQQCISRLQDLEVRYEREPEQTPIASLSGGPLKLSDLAKNKPQQTTIIIQQQKSPQQSGPSGNIKSFDGGKTGGGGNTALSSSLAAKEVKLDKKPKPINVEVQMDDEERESLTEPELQHFSRPQPSRKNNKRSDLPKLEDERSDDEVSTWQENPNAFQPGGEKKESKLKSTFGNLKASLFSKDEKDNNNGGTTSPTPQSNTVQQNNNNINNSGRSSQTYNQPPTYNQPSSAPPPIKPAGPPPMSSSNQSNTYIAPLDTPSSSSGGPPRLNIPPPPPTPTHGSR